MEPEFWLQRWRDGRIGFHEGRPNVLLGRHEAELPGSDVFVPLCGKAEDMAFLAAAGRRVVGVDVAETALEQFFEEHGMEPRSRAIDDLKAFEDGPFTLIAGDLYACTPEKLGHFTALYDRAALVAIDPETREAYVAHLLSLLAPGGAALFVVFEYDQNRMEGPPYSVPASEVERLALAAHPGAVVSVLETIPASLPRIAEQSGALEHAVLVQLPVA